MKDIHRNKPEAFATINSKGKKNTSKLDEK